MPTVSADVRTLATIGTSALFTGSNPQLGGVVINSRPVNGSPGAWSHPVAADVPAGSLLLLGLVGRSAFLIDGVSDTKGNAYSIYYSGGSPYTGVAVATCLVTRPLIAGVDSIQLSYIQPLPDLTSTSLLVQGVYYTGVPRATPLISTWRAPFQRFPVKDESAITDSGVVACPADNAIVVAIAQGITPQSGPYSVGFESRPWEVVLDNTFTYADSTIPQIDTAHTEDLGRRAAVTCFQVAQKGDLLRMVINGQLVDSEAFLIAFRVPGAAHPLDVKTFAAIRGPHATRELSSSAAISVDHGRALSSSAVIGLHSSQAGGDLDVATFAAIE